MKNSFFIVVCLGLFLFSCNGKKPSEKVDLSGAMATSSGKINYLTVVMENDLWEGEIGEAVRKHLAAPVDGLPQEEPLFSMSQMPTVAFSGFARKNRTFLQIKKGGASDYTILKSKYANPQAGVVITGKTNHKIIKVLEDNLEATIAAFKSTEIREKHRRISKSLKKLPTLKEKLKVSLKLPTAYRIAKETASFFWIRKDIPQGSMNLLAYEVSPETIQKSPSTIEQVIKMRDSIGAIEILTDKGGVFVTEEAYAPYLFESTIDNRFAFETKGTWEVKNRFMAGPFVNYAIVDKANNRILILEGFVFAPSVNKRDHMFELEAIIKSAKLF